MSIRRPPLEPTEPSHQLAQVTWTGPFSYHEVVEGPAANKKGMYQVYGHHVVFGPNSLLYIGMTDKQTFGTRFAQHFANWLEQENDVQIRLGLLDQAGVQLLQHVEALTIWWHSPPYNSKGIWLYKGPPLRVQNCERRGLLHPEYSSPWKPNAAKEPPEGEVE